MDTEVFHRSLELVARLVDRRDFADAATVLRPWLDTDLDAQGKAIVCVNLAVVSDHQGSEDAALAWYEHGAHYQPNFVTEEKAAWLARKGRRAESLAAYRALLPLVGGADRNRIEQNIEVLASG